MKWGYSWVAGSVPVPDRTGTGPTCHVKGGVSAPRGAGQGAETLELTERRPACSTLSTRSLPLPVRLGAQILGSGVSGSPICITGSLTSMKRALEKNLELRLEHLHLD